MLGKAEVRRDILRWRDDLAPSDKTERERRISDWIRRWLSTLDRGTMLAYRPIRSEVDIRPAVEWAWSRGWTVAFPRVEGEELKAVAAANWGDFRPGAFGIPEPEGPPLDPAVLDVILVPGVAFDRRGNRLGYGRGYYDRFLRSATGARLAGVAFSGQWLERLPVDPHDVPVQYIITESGIWRVEDGCFTEVPGMEGETCGNTPTGRAEKFR